MSAETSRPGTDGGLPRTEKPVYQPLAELFETIGSPEAETAYTRVLQEYGEQQDPVAIATARLSAMTSTNGTPCSRQISSIRVWRTACFPTANGEALMLMNRSMPRSASSSTGLAS